MVDAKVTLGGDEDAKAYEKGEMSTENVQFFETLSCRPDVTCRQLHLYLSQTDP